MSNNQRKLERHSIAAGLDVWDASTDEYLGRLVNIHAEGMMLLAPEPLVEDKLYELRLTLPQNFSSSGELTLGVDCLWVRAADPSDATATGHWAGCQIIDASPQAREVIALLVNRLAAI